MSGRVRLVMIVLLLASSGTGWSAMAPLVPPAAPPPTAESTLTTVILVRHAEKAAAPVQDPALTATGRARARSITGLLAQATVSASVHAVYASPFQRTRQTARPLAEWAGVPILSYDPRDSEAVAAQVLREHVGRTVLIVGHSNTLPLLAQAFGADLLLPEIEDDEYDNLYVLSVPAPSADEAPPASVLRLALPAPVAEVPPGPSALAAVQAWHLVRDQFVDPEAVTGGAWERAFAEYLGPLPPDADPTRASAAINAMLATLNTSHTSHYTPLDTAWYQLLGIFGEQFPTLRQRRFGADDGEVSYAGLPIAVQRVDGRVFVSGIYRPLQLAGDTLLLVGDEILSVDGAPFDEIEPFLGKAGRVATLGIRREAQGMLLEVPVVVERLRPSTLFLEAIEAGARVLEPGADTRIAYIPMWSYAGVAYHEALKAVLRGDAFATAEALVLDLRGGWGGADPSYADYFLSRTASLSMTTRVGVRSTFNEHWHRPLVLLVDDGTRSGKEVLARTLQAHGVPLVGTRTAGAVTGGRPFVLLDDSLLYLAVATVSVDGEELEGQGVEPDALVARGLPYAAGADPQLARAIQIAQSLINPPADATP